MEHLKFYIFARTLCLTGVLFFVFQASALDMKRFDAPDPQRGKYLAFTKPARLTYGSSPLPVDRRTLIMPANIKVVTTTLTVESNSTNQSETNASPESLSKIENPALEERPPLELFQNIPAVAPPVSLPLSDPFEEVSSVGIDSTDELLDVFESSSFSSPRGNVQDIPFVPPYTVAPDNMRITNRSTYQRRQR
jgi:hypothetical protein